MGLESVKKELLKTAELEAKQIVQDAQKEAAALKKKTDEQISEYEKMSKLDLKRIIEEMKRKEIASVHLEKQSLVRNARKKMLQEVFDTTLKTLHSSPSAEKKRLLEMLLARAQKEIDVAQVMLSKEDFDLLKNKSVKMKPSEIEGGLVAETKDEKISVNLSFEAILGQLREELAMKVQEVLFGHE